jgi:hypothetical protein
MVMQAPSHALQNKHRRGVLSGVDLMDCCNR